MTYQKRHQANKKGQWAEAFAAAYLQCKGYRILRRRYKTRYGEIDLIAQKGRVVAMVEVKARRTIGGALESVTPRNQKRIEAAAHSFLATLPADVGRDIRFDVIAVGWPWFVRHLDNAWRPRP